jgi:uncharacterized protein (TIGR03382 family)
VDGIAQCAPDPDCTTEVSVLVTRGGNCAYGSGTFSGALVVLMLFLVALGRRRFLIKPR